MQPLECQAVAVPGLEALGSQWRSRPHRSWACLWCFFYFYFSSSCQIFATESQGCPRVGHASSSLADLEARDRLWPSEDGRAFMRGADTRARPQGGEPWVNYDNPLLRVHSGPEQCSSGACTSETNGTGGRHAASGIYAYDIRQTFFGSRGSFPPLHRSDESVWWGKLAAELENGGCGAARYRCSQEKSNVSEGVWTPAPHPRGTSQTVLVSGCSKCLATTPSSAS